MPEFDEYFTKLPMSTLFMQFFFSNWWILFVKLPRSTVTIKTKWKVGKYGAPFMHMKEDSFIL